jgi:hypothetical protein
MSLLTPRNLLVAGGLFGLGVAASPWIRAKLAGTAIGKQPVALSDAESDVPEDAPTVVRAAGPDAMRDAPVRKWDRVDQAVDESFPASDPPSSY